MTTHRYSLGAMLFVVCAGLGEVSSIVNSALFTLPPSCRSLESYWSISTLASSLRETCCCATSNHPLGVTNEESYICYSSHQEISGTVAGESSIQDRGGAHYLLSLLFSLVSLPFSFYLCLPYQKILLLPWVPMKTPSCVTLLVTTTVTLSALLSLHLPLQHLLMRLNLLCLTLS